MNAEVGQVANLSYIMFGGVIQGALRRPERNENRRRQTGLLRFARNDTEGRRDCFVIRRTANSSQ